MKKNAPVFVWISMVIQPAINAFNFLLRFFAPKMYNYRRPYKGEAAAPVSISSSPKKTKDFESKLNPH